VLELEWEQDEQEEEHDHQMQLFSIEDLLLPIDCVLLMPTICREEREQEQEEHFDATENEKANRQEKEEEEDDVQQIPEQPNLDQQTDPPFAQSEPLEEADCETEHVEAPAFCSLLRPLVSEATEERLAVCSSCSTW
jgi:hypothetical protein